MARLYANENFPFAVVQQLRNMGHNAITIQETGRGGQRVPDPDVLRFATDDQRAVLTLNRRDFIRLHNLSSQHAGIIVCTADNDTIGQADRIDHAIKGLDSLDGLLIRVYRGNA